MVSNIHIRIDYSDAIDLKRDTLLLEKSLLEAVQHIKEYNSLRKKEFTLKNQVKRDLNELKTSIIQLDSLLPKEDLIEIEKVQKQNKLVKTIKKERAKSIPIEDKRDDLEYQLSEIKNKLSKLGIN